MKRFALKVTTLSPLSIRADHSPGGAKVAPYIAGSALMGCLASAHRLLHSSKGSEFVEFFLSDKVRYPHLYPASFKNERMHNAFSSLYCIPSTAQSCKRFKGFLPLHDDRDDDEDRHGVRDSLFDWAMFTLLGKAEHIAHDEEIRPIIASLQESGSKKPESRRCTCGEPLDSFDGFYRWESGDYAVAEPQTRLLTRTGINRKYGTAEEKILYNREVYKEENCFFGVIQATEDVTEAFQKFIEKKGSEGHSSLLLTDFAHLGTARTRGFGQVEFQVDSPDDVQDDFEAFKERLRSFDTALREYVHKPASQPYYIAITLHSPIILCDELLRYEGSISGERLASLTGLPANTFELLYHSASVRRVMAWQELWGLPRMHAYAIDAGSVFLFAVQQPLDNTLARALFALEEQGIGQRRVEGFGRISISDPFHRERNLR